MGRGGDALVPCLLLLAMMTRCEVLNNVGVAVACDVAEGADEASELDALLAWLHRRSGRQRSHTARLRGRCQRVLREADAGTRRW